MNSIQQLLDQAQEIIRESKGIYSKLYFYKASLITTLDEASNTNSGYKKLSFLKDPELTKIRAKLEKKYPALPDLTKIQGYEVYVQNADTIYSALTPSFQLFTQTLEYLNKTKKLILDFPSKIFEFKLKKNRPIMLMWIDLVLIYIRACYLLTFIPEKSTIIAMYTAASHLVDPSNQVRYVNEMKTLLDDNANLLKHFQELFQPHQQLIMDLCYELQDSLQLTSNSETIRDKNLFNPIYEGSQMHKPAQKTVNTVNDLSAYREIVDLSKYYDFIGFSFLICSSLLFHEKHFTLLEHFTNYRIFLTVYRDLSVNIHIELEKLQVLFDSGETPNPEGPSATGASASGGAGGGGGISSSLLNLIIPKGYKLKNQLKALSRNSIANVAKKQRSRRLILRNDIEVLTKLLAVSPGLLGPKFPMILALASMMQAEIFAYFQHYPYSPSATEQQLSAYGGSAGSANAAGGGGSVSNTISNFLQLRKDTKSYYTPDEFKSNAEIASCLEALSRLIQIIKSPTGQSIVSQYYCEYLFNYHSMILNQLNASFAQHFPALNPIFQLLIGEFQLLKEKPESSYVPATIAAIRYHYFHLVLLFSHPTMSTSMKSQSTFYNVWLQSMELMMEHLSYYYYTTEAVANGHDRVEGGATGSGSNATAGAGGGGLLALIRDKVHFYEIHWFRDAFLSSFTEICCINGGGNNTSHSKDSGSAATTASAIVTSGSSTRLIYYFEALEHYLFSLERVSLSDEIKPLTAASTQLCQTMLTMVSERFQTLLKGLWEYYGKLEYQYNAIEAVARLERAIQARYKNHMARSDAANGGGDAAGGVQEEALPGYESEEVIAERLIGKFIGFHRELIALVHSFMEKKKITLFTKEISFILFLREEANQFIRSKLTQQFFHSYNSHTSSSGGFEDTGNSSRPYRYSYSFYKFLYGLRLLQTVYQYFDLNVGHFIKILLASEFTPSGNSLSPIGLLTPPIGATGGGWEGYFFEEYTFLTKLKIHSSISPHFTLPVQTNSGNNSASRGILLEKFAQSYATMIYEISKKGSTLIYVPYKNQFSNLSNLNGQTSHTSNSGGHPTLQYSNIESDHFAIELYLNAKEMQYLISIIGIYGYLYLEKMFIHIIADQMVRIVKVLKQEIPHILNLEKEYCLSMASALLMSKSLPELAQSLKVIGTTLVIRQMLSDALAVVSQENVNDLYDSLHLLQTSLNHWTALSPPSSATSATSGSSSSSSNNNNKILEMVATGQQHILLSLYSLLNSFGQSEERENYLSIAIFQTVLTKLRYHNSIITSQNNENAGNSFYSGITEEDLGVLEYLPIAAAALFALPELVEISPSSHYSMLGNSSGQAVAGNLFQVANVYNVYQHLSHNNQHLLAYGLAKGLLFTFNYFQYKGLDMKVIINHRTATTGQSSSKVNNSNGSGTSSNLNHQAKKASILEDYRIFIEIYIKISAQIILTIHTTAINAIENPNSSASSTAAAATIGHLNHSHISFNSLYLQLFDFLDYCHYSLGESRNIVEKYLMSYDLVQTAFNNLALGRVLVSDKFEKIPLPNKMNQMLPQQQMTQMNTTTTAIGAGGSGGAMY